MKSSLTIMRNTGESHPWGFAQLRKEGIEISQALSGSGWTDYNYHDPGVTILEQLCFALTDLIYRSKFDVADYLCDMRGDIDLQSLGLHAPEDVLFSRPSTVLDYQKALADMSHDINDVRIATDGDEWGAGGYGLYRVKVRSSAQFGDDAPEAEDLVRQTTRNFHRVRNLCEDLESEVTVAEDVDCQLLAEISIKPGYRVAHLVAELFHLAVREMDKGVSYSSYSEGLEEGKALDELFSGPYTRNGLIGDNAFTTAGEDQDLRLLESAILSRARKIEGIDYIAALRLRPMLSLEDDDSERRYRISIPNEARDFRDIRPFVSGRPVNFAIAEFKAQFEMLRFAGRTKAYRLSEDRLLSQAQTGTYRDLSRYQSVQNQFPAAYGINRYGVPDGDSPERQAQALQLKAYLLLFEQIMSNYLANLGSIRQLFSVRVKEKSTYFKGILTSDEIGDLQAVYPENAEQVLDDILSRLDDFVGRKGRLLDYLLALYGEEFNQEHLRGLNYYYSEDEMRRVVILNKIRLLNRIKHASGDRAAAINLLATESPDQSPYGELEGGRVSGLQYRSSIFLGFKDLAPKSLVGEVFRHKLLIEQSNAPGDTVDSRAATSGDSESFVQRAQSLFGAIEDSDDSRYYRIVRRNCSEIEPLREGKLDVRLLQNGVRKENYFYRDGKLRLRLVVDSAEDALDDAEIELLSVAEEEKQAKIRFLNRLFIHLSKECEGMHVLEHILLRPPEFTSLPPEVKEHYANRVSVFLPAWTARGNDPQFRALAEDILRENCPAHIQLNTYWLDFSAMCEYEVLQHDWLNALRATSDRAGSGHVAEAGQKLQRFVEERKLALFRDKAVLLAIRERIAEKVGHKLDYLRIRRRDLELSQRRESDPEHAYLQGIEALEQEIKAFAFLLVNHSELKPEDGINKQSSSIDDWSFYVGRSSVLLPRPKAFKATSTHKRHFHAIKEIIEQEIAAAMRGVSTITFHWLVPGDFKRMARLYAKRGDTKAQHTLRELLSLLESRSDITGSAHGWQRLLGDAE